MSGDDSKYFSTTKKEKSLSSRRSSILIFRRGSKYFLRFYEQYILLFYARKYIQTWKSLLDSNEVIKDCPGILIENVEATPERLAASNMFFIAKRKNVNQDVFYFSATIPRGIPLLIELTTLIGTPWVKCAVKTSSSDMAPLFFEAIETLLTQSFSLFHA